MTERDENWVPSDEYVPQEYTPSVHTARSTFAFARAKGDKSRRGMYFDAFDRMIEAVRQEEREKAARIAVQVHAYRGSVEQWAAREIAQAIREQGKEQDCG